MQLPAIIVEIEGSIEMYTAARSHFRWMKENEHMYLLSLSFKTI